MSANNSDGIVLWLKATPAGATYYDYKGVVQSVGTLTTSYQASDEFNVGRPADLIVTAHGLLSGGHTVSCALQLKDASPITAGDGLTRRWKTAQMLRLDTGAAGTAGVQTIAAADLLDLIDGTTAGALSFGTANHRGSAVARVIAKASAATGTDEVVFTVEWR